MTRGGVAGLLSLALGPFGWCVALGAVVGGDPMLALEIGGGAFALLWVALVAIELVRAHRLSRALAADAQPATLHGVSIHLTPVLGLDAIVIGSIRPRIYLGTAMLAALSDDEVRAVLLHEDHHRRTHAPLRAAAIDAWLRLCGRSERIRGVLLDRLADLETLADADAIRRGSSPRTLARALLKGDTSLRPVAFAYAAERRLERLLDHAAGDDSLGAARRLPYEWFPVIALTVATLGCHAGL